MLSSSSSSSSSASNTDSAATTTGSGGGAESSGGDSLRQSVLSLDIFKYLSGAVELLKRQPRGRQAASSASRVREDSSEYREREGVGLGVEGRGFWGGRRKWDG